jgi:hypothetical protein
VGPPCQQVKREKATSSEGANQKGKRISTGAPSAHGPDGLVREAAAYGGRAGRLGQIPGKIQIRN